MHEVQKILSQFNTTQFETTQDFSNFFFYALGALREVASHIDIHEILKDKSEKDIYVSYIGIFATLITDASFCDYYAGKEKLMLELSCAMVYAYALSVHQLEKEK